MRREGGTKRRLTCVCIVVSFLATSCGGTSSAVPETDSALESAPTSTAVEATTSQPVSSTTEPELDPEVPREEVSAIDETGPIGQSVIHYDDDGYFDALGVDAVRLTLEAEGRPAVVIEFDRFGAYHSEDRWVLDGELVLVEADGYVDVMWAGNQLFTGTLQLSMSIDDEVQALLAPISEMTVDGSLRHQHRADPADLLAYEVTDHPEWWEWNSASYEVITNPKGAMVRAEYVNDYVWVPAPNMVNPPAPRETLERTIYSVEPIDEVTPFPAGVNPAPDRDDRRTQDLLAVAASSFDSQISFAPAVGAAALAEGLAGSPLDRFEISIADDIDFASTEVMGLLGGVLLLRSESGTWFCNAARADRFESRTEINSDGSFGEQIAITASGADPEAVIRECQNARDDLREAQGLSAWNR